MFKTIRTINYADWKNLIASAVNGVFYFDDSSNVFVAWAFAALGTHEFVAVLTLASKPGTFNTDFSSAVALTAPIDIETD